MGWTAMSGTRELRKNERRQAILEAARTLMLDRRSDDFSMPTLAKKAGVSLVTPYNLFGSKANILIEIVREDVFARAAEIHSLPCGDLTVWVGDMARVLARVFYTRRLFYRRMIESIVSQQSADSQRAVLAMSYQIYESPVEKLMAAHTLAAPVTASTVARYIAHVVSGTLQEQLMERTREDALRIALEKGILLVVSGLCSDSDRMRMHARLAELEDRPA
jgi:AcrR family transcriptional regulator